MKLLYLCGAGVKSLLDTSILQPFIGCLLKVTYTLLIHFTNPFHRPVPLSASILTPLTHKDKVHSLCGNWLVLPNAKHGCLVYLSVH